MKFNIGDHVRLKDGVDLMEFDNPHNKVIQGTIVSEIEEEDTLIVDLDADSILLLSDDYLKEIVDLDMDSPWEVYLQLDELELAEPRQSKKSKDEAIEIIWKKIDLFIEILEAEAKNERLTTELVENQVTAFFHSEPCMYLSYKHQKVSPEILFSILPELIYQAEHNPKKRWTAENIESFFNEKLPQLDAEPVFFEMYGDVLLAYFDFANQTGIDNIPASVRKYVERIKDQIPSMAADKKKWDLLKRLKVEARKRGVDVIDLPSGVLDQMLEEHKKFTQQK